MQKHALAENAAMNQLSLMLSLTRKEFAWSGVKLQSVCWPSQRYEYFSSRNGKVTAADIAVSTRTGRPLCDRESAHRGWYPVPTAARLLSYLISGPLGDIAWHKLL
eukprot:1045571-Rhodomonas_salina.4